MTDPSIVSITHEESDEPLVFVEITWELGSGGPIRHERGYVHPSSDEASLVYTLSRPRPDMPFPPKIEVSRKYLISVREQPLGGQ
ncbi:hypothetical protein [Rhodococcoides fascians]|uniref:hypothetical protein n=1 Tax=Rhodococcoides fascians TaxID=1828 RepID=UPI00050C040F|nr:hypothetical protein [Rhodococcus fascians]